VSGPGSTDEFAVDPLRAWWYEHLARAKAGIDPTPAATLAAPSIVVCVHDAIDAARACIESLLRARRLPYRILLVDDASAPACAAMLQDYAARHGFITCLRLDSNLGYTRAANHGLRHASGEFVVLLNSDTEVAPGWIESLLTCAVSGSGIGLVGPLSNAASWQTVPQALNPDGSLARHSMPSGAALLDLCGRLTRLSPRLYPRVDLLNGFCLGIRRTVLEQVGLLDEAAFPHGYGEENDYCLRARAAGFELAVADDAYVAHRKSASFGHSRRADLSQRGDAALRRKHGDARVDAALLSCRDNARLAAVRRIAALALAPRHPQPIPLEPARRILFVLTAQAGGGGAHSVVQEAQAMRELGFDARIAVPAPFRSSFVEAYPAMGDIDDWLLAFVDAAELGCLAEGVAIVVATVFTSIAFIDQALPAQDGRLFAYYIQDYEPRFFDPETPARTEAEASYHWPRCGLRFAKTDWIREQVQRHHGVPVAKVRPSLEDAVYRPPAVEPASGIPTLAAMLRPATPRRAPARTLRVLDSVRQQWQGPLHIRLFGCTSDELEPALARLAQGMELLGHLRREQVAEVLQSALAFLDLSDYQAFGRTGLEAMACGCVPLLPREGGCGEFAEDGVNAVLVDTGSEEACVQATLALLHDEPRRLALRRAGLRTSAGFNRRAAAVSELVAFSNAVVRESRLDVTTTEPPVRVLRCLPGSGQPMNWEPPPPGLAAACELRDVPTEFLVESDDPIALPLHRLLRRRDLARMHHWLQTTRRPYLLYYGADVASLAELDAALLDQQGEPLLRLLHQASAVLVAGQGVQRRMRQLAVESFCVPGLCDDGGWLPDPPPAATTGGGRLLWLDPRDVPEPDAASAALERAASLLKGVIDIQHCPAPGLHRRSAAEWSAWLHQQLQDGPCLAIVAQVSPQAAAGGRSRLWQRRIAALGACPILNLDEETASLANGSEGHFIEPDASAWLEFLASLPGRRAELAAIGDNARRMSLAAPPLADTALAWRPALDRLVAATA